MGMGIVSDEEFESELKNSVVREEVIKYEDIKRPGRTEGTPNTPDSLRKIIGETSGTESRREALELSKNFGISPSSVSAYSHGSTSTKTYNEQPNLDHIIKAKERVSSRARFKLMKALNHLTDEKLEGAKAVDIALVARSMSAVIRDMEPPTPKDNEEVKKGGPTFIFYSPQIRDEKHYDIIAVRE